MMFSVVIPLYNKEDTIERTLRSVAGQTCHDFEVVVVDDGSTDASVEVVRQFKGGIPLRLIRQENTGVSAARNCGVQHAGGKYISFLDADDEWLPNHLADAAELITMNRDAIIVGCGYKWSLGMNVYSTRPWCYGKVDFIKSYSYYQPTHTSSIVIRRDAIIEAGGYDTKYSFYEDLDLFFRVAVRHKDGCYLVGRPSSIYHSDAESKLTGGGGTRHFIGDYPHLRYLEGVIATSGGSNGMRKYMFWHLLRTVVDQYCCGNIEFIQRLIDAFPHSTTVVHRFWRDARFIWVKRILACLVGMYLRFRFYTYISRGHTQSSF